MRKFQASNRSLSIISGICLVLFALVILFSPNTPFRFLTIAITSAFGFVGFWFILPIIIFLTIVVIFKIKFPIKTKFLLIGLSMSILALGILFSNIGNELTIHNASSVFKDLNNQFLGSYLSIKLGGGFIGFIIAGVFNSLITKIGTYILSSVLFLAGLFVILNKQIISLIKKNRAKAKSKKDKNDEEDESIKIEPIEEVSNEDNIITTYHSEDKHSNLKKAHFTFESKIEKEETPSTLVENNAESFSEPVAEANTKEVEIVPEVKEPEQETPLAKPVFVPEVNEVEPKKPEVVENYENIDPLYRPQPKAHLAKDYVYPSLDLLLEHENNDDYEINESSCGERTNIINDTFNAFKVGASVVGHTIGPSVTRFDVRTNPDVSVNAINKYIDDLSVRLNGLRVRFEPIVAGKSTSGLEVPNEKRTTVGLKESILKIPNDPKHLRYIPFGKNISGDLISADLSEFPHMLVSGTTGSGKTIFIHSVILTLIMRNKPEELKILLIDPKKVEMNYYKEIPHLICPNISDSRKAYVALQRLVDEMERRYNLFQANELRDIKGFNVWAKQNNVQPLPYIVVFVDEYADLADSCKEVREPVVRIAQKARAAGIHLVLATQRPSVNIIDGVIKGNIATRVALLSASSTDSITIIGEGGAEKLLGNGDMLIESPLLSTCGRPRVQGCFVDTGEIIQVCKFLRNHYQPEYDPNFLNLEEKPQQSQADIEVQHAEKGISDDELYEMIKEDVMTKFEYASISLITRSYSVGFTRAGKLFRRLQNEGIVELKGDSRGCKVLVHIEPNQEQQIGTIEQSTFIPDRNDD